MKKLWTDLHSNIHHNQMDELDKWTEHAKEVLDFWPIAYYPFQMIKTESGAGLEDLCPEEEIKNCLLYTSPSPRDRTRLGDCPRKSKRRKCKRISDVYGI